MKKFITENFHWLKSFVSDAPINGEELKGSSKRLVALILVVIFMFYYKSVTDSYLQRIESFTNKEFIEFMKFNEFKPPDIPEVWALLLGGILAVNVADFFLRRKIFNESETQTRITKLENK